METEKNINNSKLKVGCLVFGILTAICMYNASGGIGFALYYTVMAIFFGCYLHWTGRSVKPESLFLGAIALVLAYSTIFTIDSALRFWDFLMIFLLSDRILLHQFREDGYWSISQHIVQLGATIIRVLENLGALIDLLFPALARKRAERYSVRVHVGNKNMPAPLHAENLREYYQIAAKENAQSTNSTEETSDLCSPEENAVLNSDSTIVTTSTSNNTETDAPASTENTSQKKSSELLVPIIIGVIIAIPLLIIVLVALTSADQIFADVINKIISIELIKSFFNNLLPILLWSVVGALLSCATLTCFDKRKEEPLPVKTPTHNPVIAITILSILGAVYVLFCAIQIIFLFGKASLPDGFTYASYARQGFFQLLFVCVLNVILMLLTTEVFRESRVLRLLSVGFSICTLIMNIAATYRMCLYISAYDMTCSRFVAMAGLIVVYFLLGGLVIRTYRKSFPFFSYMVLVLALTMVCMNLMNPARFVARYNLEHSENPDIYYLVDLGPEAFPVVDEAYQNGDLDAKKYQEYLRTEISSYMMHDFIREAKEEADDFRSYNVARQNVIKILKEYDLYKMIWDIDDVEVQLP